MTVANCEGNQNLRPTPESSNTARMHTPANESLPLETGTATRRRFLTGSAALAVGTGIGAAGCVHAGPQAITPPGEPAQTFDLSRIPNFCAHEHWGSLTPFGHTPDGFRADVESGATPARPVSVWDLVLDPYGMGWLMTDGLAPNQLAKAQNQADFHTWWKTSPEKALKALHGPLTPHLLTGGFQSVRRGILALHGVDIAAMDLEALQEADRRVSAAYADTHAWYRTAMEKSGFSELIRPVHPLFHFRQEKAETDRAERAFTHSILRIDPLLKMWAPENAARQQLAEQVGVDPADAVSWREFLGRLLDAAAKNGGSGIKQLQAYLRPLDFKPRTDGEVKFRGKLSPDEEIVFQDWVVHECCKQAHDRHWPHQVHVGTHNLPESSPLPLDGLARRYPNMSLVMLHCWPYLSESACVAKLRPNAYIDTCWQVILNPDFYRRALNEWLGYLPATKIMCSHDATSVEMAAGSSVMVRAMLAEGLSEHGASAGVKPEALRQMATDMLQNNAVRIYGFGNSA